MIHDHRTELLRMMGKIACIFGVPALVALAGGLSLDRFFGIERRYVLAILAVSFVFSWVLMWRFYRRIRYTEKISRQATDGMKDIGTVQYDVPGRWESKK